MVYNLLNNITDCFVNSDIVCFQKVNSYKQQLLILSRAILKEEWERVKKESKRCVYE